MTGASAPATPGPTDRTVVVTGGAGFIGGHLVDALLPDNDVYVFDHFDTHSPDDVPSEACVVDGDVRDVETLAACVADADVVFHQAANVSVERSVADPTESHRINVDGTLNVLEAAREADARVVYASSAAIYGTPESVPVSESAPTRPTSPYGAEKLSADQYVRLYADLYDLETVALRYFNVYGPRQTAPAYSGVISAFLARAMRGEPLEIHGDGSQTRDFVHVSDVVRANLLAATTDRVGEAYNVGTGESVSVADLAALVVDATDSDSEIVHTDARAGDVDHSEADVSKARAELGFDPQIPLRNGLESLVRGESLP